MRTSATVLLLAILAVPAARAQSADEPSLAFTISGGLSTGQTLWNVDNQQLLAPNGGYDTVRLGRRIIPGLSASLGMSFFRSPHWGLNAEIGYFGTASEQMCIGPASGFVPGNGNINEEACTEAHGKHKASSVIAFMVGAVFQFFDSSRVRPFVRANVGLGLIGTSFVETIGIVHDTSCVTSDNICPYTLLLEDHKPSASPVASISGGVSVSIGEGYRLRMEGRDLIVRLPQVTGPAPPSNVGNVATTRMVFKHVPVFMIGFDVLLERRRSRRY